MMIEYDDALLDLTIPLHRVEIVTGEPIIHGRMGYRGALESRTMTMIRRVLQNDNDQWIGRFCCGESIGCNQHGEKVVERDGFYSHRKDVLLFDDADTAFSVKLFLT